MVSTINPAECDRTTVYTGECRNYSDTAWVPFQSGRRRAPDAPDYPWLVDSGTGSFWTRDTHVRNLVPLVPGPAPAVSYADIEKAVAEWVDDAPEVVNEVWSLVSGSDPAVFVVRESQVEAVEVESGTRKWTAADLPAVFDDSRRPGRPWNPSPDMMSDLAAWLNAHHPKPVPGMLWATKADADHWRRAHAIVERERDQERESLHEACKLAQSYRVDAYQATERAEAAEQYAQAVSDSNRDNADRASKAERQCDEVQERADQLRDERDDAVQSCITLGRALDEWQARAEAAEARTGIDRIRAVLDKCANDTRPGENDYMGTYDAYESAIDAISRIAYPEGAA